VKKSNEIVTIDRLKPYKGHDDDDEGQLSQAPPSDTDLSAAGDEFLERFQVSETPPQDDDITLPRLPQLPPVDTAEPIQEQVVLPPPPAPEPAPEADDDDYPNINIPAQQIEDNIHQHFEDNGGVVVAPPRPQPRNRVERLLEEARRFVGPDLGHDPDRRELRARNEQPPAEDSDSNETSDYTTSDSDSDSDFIAYIKNLTI
jgi:hypothetical protein